MREDYDPNSEIVLVSGESLCSIYCDGNYNSTCRYTYKDSRLLQPEQ